VWPEKHKNLRNRTRHKTFKKYPKTIKNFSKIELVEKIAAWVIFGRTKSLGLKFFSIVCAGRNCYWT
jgi:hypothetical protein